MKTAISGASGRMGITLARLLHEHPDFTLTAAFDAAASPAIGRDVGELAGLGRLGVPVTADLAGALEGFDLLIDFSVPQATLAALPHCVSAGKKLVIGTTGFDADGQAAIEAAAREVAVLKAPNMSVGVNLTFKLVEMAARALGDDVDVEVLEMHHRHKVDAPSGTAVRLGEVLAQTLGRDLAQDAIYGREGHTGPRQRRTIGFSTLRGGDVVGEHTVIFAGTGERIEITHRAQSRDNFGEGALRAAAYLADKPRGLFDMQDVLGLRDPLR